MNKLLLLTTALLILLSSFVIADPEQYLMPGVTRDSTYNQDGTGLWNERTPVTYQRAYTTLQSYYPLVADTDGDGDNEIVLLADDEIKILNYTTGVGLLVEDALTHGNVQLGTTAFRLTPALFDADSDGIYDIISWNGTHIIHTEWNGTSYEITNSVATSELNTTPYAGSPRPNPNPIIKCAQGNQFSTGNDTCFFTLQNLTGANLNSIMLIYDVDANTLKYSVVHAVAQSKLSYSSMHLADGDNDGYLEAYTAYYDTRYQWVYSTDDTNLTTQLLLYDFGDINDNQLSDIIINNMDGVTTNGLEISFGYTDDGVNYDITTYNAKTGALVKSGYMPLLFESEGTSMSNNLFQAATTTYALAANDVCMYIRNPTESYPDPNVDTVFCADLISGGAGYKQTEVANTVNVSNTLIVHEAKIAGTQGLLLNKYVLAGGTKQATPILSDTVNIPVDYQIGGSLDIIGLSTTNIYYYDDAYQNTNYDFTGLTWDTGNCVLQNEIVTFTLALKDVEEDSGVCYVQDYYGNNTLISTSSNNSIIESQFTNELTTTSINYFAANTGTYILKFSCKDQYHTTYDTQDYTIVIGNDTSSCHSKGVAGSSIVIVPTVPLSCNVNSDCPADYECSEANVCIAVKPVADSMTDVMSDIGILGTGGKAFFWLLLMIGLAFLIFSSYSGEGIVYIIALLEVVMLVMGWVLGMVGTVPLVIIGLLCGVLLTFMWMKGNPGGG